MTVSYDPWQGNEGGEPRTDLIKHFAWPDILEAQSDPAMQRQGWRRYKPKDSGSACGCQRCQLPASALEWIYFANRGERSGRCLEGWIVACMDCHEQTDFIPTLIG